MKFQKMILPLAMFVALLFPGLAAGAMATQWFPAAGTTIDYNTTFFYNWQNGTSVESTQFTIYNGSTLGYYICPLILANGPTAFNFTGYPVLASDTSVIVRHMYADESSTTLSRTSVIVAGNVTLATSTADFIYQTTSGSITYMTTPLPGAITIDKVGFGPAPNNNDWLDHVDNSLEPGRYFSSTFQVVSYTSTQMVLRDSYNRTYTAGTDGKVESFTDFSNLYTPGGFTAGYIYEVAAGVPGPSLGWILAAVAVGVVMATLLIRRSNRINKG